jgi:hypothetical protein
MYDESIKGMNNIKLNEIEKIFTVPLFSNPKLKFLKK